MKPTLLAVCPIPQALRSTVSEHFDLLYAPDPATKLRKIAERAAEIRAVVTVGPVGLAAADIDALPALEIICTLGVGYEKIDVAAARARGIVIANGAGTNAAVVADHAFGLLIGVVRAIPAYDAATRQGLWRDKLASRPTVSGKRIGIVGFGTIGQTIARRASGFDLEVGYHARHARPDVPQTYFDSVNALADWADYLVMATPGGPETRHMVDASVLDALGPTGFLVNISRGSVVDTAALADALKTGSIAGAGLDVYESEPEPPVALLDCPNLVLTPHTAGTSPESNTAGVARFIENALLHFAGKPPVSPV